MSAIILSGDGDGDDGDGDAADISTDHRKKHRPVRCWACDSWLPIDYLLLETPGTSLTIK